MSPPVRLALTITANQSGTSPDTWVSASVQVWQDKRHLTTFNLIEFCKIALPESAPLDTIENYAAVCARVLARVLDEVQFDAIASKTLHHLRDLSEAASE